MTKKKTKTSRARHASHRDFIRAAASIGASIATEAFEERQRVSKRREGVGRRAAPSDGPSRRAAPVAAKAQIPEATHALLGPKPTSGVLIAEGDSWFDYPRQDVLRLLEDDHLYDVESVAHKGDCVEDMAHSSGQFEEFARRLEKLLRDGKIPRAILLSGGGNDIAGDEFAILLNHAASPLPPLNEEVLHGIVEVRLRAAYATIIGGLTTIAKKYLNRAIPIVMHGYDYALPDGRGFLGGFAFLPGPWLEPGFRRKGHVSFSQNKQVVVDIIDRFNAMLAGISAHPEFAHVRFLDLRKTLKSDDNYKDDWANELHPSPDGFDKVTAKFAALIATL